MSEPNDTNTLLDLIDVTKVYHKGDQKIVPLEKLNLKVKNSEFLALMGPSGSGKTTLLNLIAGIDSPSSGKLLFNGIDIANYNQRKLTKFRANNIGYIFQLYHLVPVLNAYENVELPLLIHPISKKDRHNRVMQALDLAGISDRSEHYPSQLSGGQEQRVAIARSLVTDPPLIVADEPTGDLDLKSATQILDLMKRMSGELGKTIVMVTHDPKAASIANRVLHLEKGVLKGSDSNDSL